MPRTVSIGNQQRTSLHIQAFADVAPVSTRFQLRFGEVRQQWCSGLHAARSDASRTQGSPAASLAELHSAPSVLVRLRCARRGVQLLSCKAAESTHSLIAGGGLSWAKSPLAPLITT